ncbi:MAG TPA: DUF4139 domain-containing protein [Candidatus Omnitrophota bacterium]|nr:DUF4139 domain-containing protein [Candidatus Omnitrophota bacterium]HOX09926.1 DUF4139 domain-containing protein [Candidatus Omnitrophota bacterium]
MKKLILAVLSLALAIPAFASESVEVTVYNQNFALIKDQRYFELDKGVNKLEFRDVASLIEPTSVHFTSLSAPASAYILEQNYEYDLVSASKLLSKYIDRKIKVVTKEGEVYEGTLMSYDDNQLVIQTASGIAMVARPMNVNNILFEKLPEGLITKPTLVWLINSDKRLRHLTEVSYLTQGMNWNCEYVTVLDKDDKALDLDGWVSITNNCGATYEDAKIKLIAGEVKRATNYALGRVAKLDYAREEKSKSEFEEKSFFEYHMYTLGRTATIKNNQTKQISLLNSVGVPVKKELIFDPSKGKNHWWYYSDKSETLKEKARVEITFMNSKADKLGMPLPKGNVKVYKKDTDGSLQFIGEDAIEHTPKDEKIRLYIGDAFDVLGERTRKDFRTEGRHTAYETFEIVLRNHKEQDADVKVVEKLWRYTNWDIASSSVRFEKKDASTMEYLAKVPKNGETKITYTVKYTW